MLCAYIYVVHTHNMWKPDPAPVHMIGTEEKVGFRLELGESPVGGASPLLDIK